MDTPWHERAVGELLSESRTAFVDALARGDAAGASDLYTDDARLIPPSADPFRGREAIAAFWQAGVDAGIWRVDLDPLEVERHGGIAYEIGRYSLHLRPADGATVVDRGTYLRVHERHESGSWRSAVEMFNPDAPAAPERQL